MHQRDQGCLTDCNAQYSTCKAEFDAIGACIKSTAKLSCQPDGDLKIEGCNSELVPFATCSACLPSVDDDACEKCSANSCCSENKALFQASDIFKLVDCANACPPNDVACNTACFNANLEAKKAFEDLQACQGKNCSAACT